jgi:hypothetical protein
LVLFEQNRKETLDHLSLSADLASESKKKRFPFFHPEARLRKMERRKSNQYRKKEPFGFTPSHHAMPVPSHGSDAGSASPLTP